MEYFFWIQSNWDTIISVGLQIVGGASLLAKLTPTHKDDELVDMILNCINKLALNPNSKDARR